MKIISIQDLKTRAVELVLSVMKTAGEIQITENDEAVALLVPLRGPRESASGWTTLDKLAAEINAEPSRE